jgi:hypothetical protein
MILCILFLGTDHLTCRGGYGFLFRSEFFFRTARVRVLSCKAQFFFQNSTLGYMTNTLNQIFFTSTKIRIFCLATLGIRIFFLKEKKHTPPLQVKWSFP